MEMTVKEQLIAELQRKGQTKDALLAMFPEQNTMRGAASVLAYLVKTGQAEIRDGVYFLTGREPERAAPKPRRQASARAAEPASSAPPLEWALWHDGDLLLRRGDVSIVLTQEERGRLEEWLPRVAA